MSDLNHSSEVQFPCTLGGEIVYCIAQTPVVDLKWPSAITRLTTHFICDPMSALVICKQRKEYGHT